MIKKLSYILICIILSLICPAVSASAADPDWDGDDIQLIFFGDSRTEGLAMCAGGCLYVGKVSAGYAWMSGTGYEQLRSVMAEWPEADVVFCFGVNDLGNVYSYIDFFRDFKAVYPDRNAYFASVNPIADDIASSFGYTVRNVSVEAFNQIVKEELPDDYLDTYTFLEYGGYDTVDGVHYGSDTYIAIQNLTMLLVEAKKIDLEMDAEEMELFETE